MENDLDDRAVFDDGSTFMLPTLMLFIRSTLFYIGYASSTILYAPVCLVVGPFLPFEQRFRFINQWSRFVIWWLKVTCNISYSIKGLDNIPKQPGAIIVSKHQSQWETFFLQLIFQPQVTVLKRELIWFPLFGWALALLRPIVIDRSKRREALAKIIKEGQERMSEGCWLLIFPEGTRTKPNQKTRFSMGAFLLSTRTQFPLIPVRHNSGYFWKPHRYLKYPGHITVEIGKPISPVNQTPEALMEKSKQWINAKSAAMRSQIN